MSGANLVEFGAGLEYHPFLCSLLEIPAMSWDQGHDGNGSVSNGNFIIMT